MSTRGAAKQVLITYAHDKQSPEVGHAAHWLAYCLRINGVDAVIDVDSRRSADWHLWMGKRVREAHYVIMVCSPLYLRCFDAEQDIGEVGRGVRWEGRLIRNIADNCQDPCGRLLPVLFDGYDELSIPVFLRKCPRYELPLGWRRTQTPPGLEKLLRRILDQPFYVPEPLGAVRRLPPRRLWPPHPQSDGRSTRDPARHYWSVVRKLDGYVRALVDALGYIEPSAMCRHENGVIGHQRIPIEAIYLPLLVDSVVTRPGQCTEFMGYPVEPQDPDSSVNQRAGESNGSSLSDSVPVRELLSAHRRLLITAEPGGGKTTFLRLLVTALGRDCLGDTDSAPFVVYQNRAARNWREALFPEAVDALSCASGPLVPIIVGVPTLCRELVGGGGDDDDDEGTELRQPNHQRVLDVLVRRSKQRHDRLKREDWAALFRYGQGILLVDGLDEAPDSDVGSALLAVLRDVALEWPDCPLIVTSRPAASMALEGLGFSWGRIASLDLQDAEAFLGQWAQATRPANVGPEHGGWSGWCRQLMDAICESEELRCMATNPGMLTAMCLVDRSGERLPECRSRLYGMIVRWLLRTRQKRRLAWSLPHGVGIEDAGFVESALKRLAFSMKGGSPEGGTAWSGGELATMSLRDAVRAVVPIVAGSYATVPTAKHADIARAWLRAECRLSGVIVEADQGQVRFSRMSFCEVLAAMYLAELDGEERWAQLAFRLESSQWREVIELMASCLLEHEGKSAVDDLLARIVDAPVDPNREPLVESAHRADLLVRLRELLQLHGYKPIQSVEEALLTALEDVPKMFTVAGAAKVPWRYRVAAAEALGVAGDDRLQLVRIELNLLPISGTGKLVLGKYPVTVQEYAHFIDAGGAEWSVAADGGDCKYCNDSGWVEPANWHAQLRTPNRPVTRVCWHQAQAYCRWLGALNGSTIRLPTRAESQAAWGTGDDTFPWGLSEPTEEHANFKRHVCAPTPVGVYPLGVGPFGHSDLAGNVSEWCAGVAYEDESGARAIWLRGGSWGDESQALRRGYEFWGDAELQSDTIGFRIAMEVS